MKNKKLVVTILAAAFIVLLSLLVAIIEGDATAFVLFLVLGICAVYSEIYNMKKRK
jgi:hypothetical protein